MKAKRILSAAAAALTALSLAACSMPPSREERAANTEINAVSDTDTTENTMQTVSETTAAPIKHYTIPERISAELQKDGLFCGMEETAAKEQYGGEFYVNGSLGDDPSHYIYYSDDPSFFGGLPATASFIYGYGFLTGINYDISLPLSEYSTEKAAEVYNGIVNTLIAEIGDPYDEENNEEKTYNKTMWGCTSDNYTDTLIYTNLYLADPRDSAGISSIYVRFYDASVISDYQPDYEEYDPYYSDDYYDDSYTEQPSYTDYCEITLGTPELSFETNTNKPCVIIPVTYTNTTVTWVDPKKAYTVKAYQITLPKEEAYIKPIFENPYTDIYRGESITINYPFLIDYSTNEIEVRIFENDYGWEIYSGTVRF